MGTLQKGFRRGEASLRRAGPPSARPPEGDQASPLAHLRGGSGLAGKLGERPPGLPGIDGRLITPLSEIQPGHRVTACARPTSTYGCPACPSNAQQTNSNSTEQGRLALPKPRGRRPKHGCSLHNCVSPSISLVTERFFATVVTVSQGRDTNTNHTHTCSSSRRDMLYQAILGRCDPRGRLGI